MHMHSYIGYVIALEAVDDQHLIWMQRGTEEVF